MRTFVRSLALLAVAAPLAAQDPAPAVVTKITADLGYVATSGNTQVTTTSVGEKLTQSRGLFSFEQKFSFVYGEQAGTEIANNLAVNLRGDYKVASRFALFGAVDYDRLPFSGISRRFVEKVGVELQAVAAPRDTVRLSVGGSVTQETSTADVTQNFPAANVTAIWRHTFTPLAYFQQNVDFIPNMKDQEDLRIFSESALVAPVSARLGLKVSYIVRYDAVPAAGFGTTDRTFTTGLQITF